MRRRPLLLGLAVLVAAVLVAGCGAAPGTGGGPITASDPYGGAPGTEGAPKRGGTLVLGTDREAVSFDPTVQNTNMASNAVYDSLLRQAPDGSVQPFLARSMTSPDGGTTWTMTLRPGVRFSDGTPLDAAAVVINTQRHIDKPTSPARTYAMMIATMRATDPLAVQFTLRSPLAEFPVIFTQTSFYGTLGMIISPAALQRWGPDIGRRPVGAGPFVLTDWTRDSRMTLARNPDYWQPGLPRLDGLELRPLPDTETRSASVRNGDVDVSFAAYNQEIVRAQQNPGLRTYYGPGNAGEYLIFNMTRAPFDDRDMREAIVRAIDRRALSASQYSGRLTPATSLFDEQSPFHTQAASDAWPAVDQARARALVDAYRARGGNPDFVLKTQTSRQPFAEFIQAQMAAIGIRMGVATYDLAQYSSAVVQSGDFQLSTTSAPLDYPFPGAARGFRTGGNSNFGRYSNPEVDRALDEAARAPDPAARTRAYQQVELQVNRDLPVTWISRAYLATITKQDVKGVERYLSRDMFYANVWLDR